MNIDGMSVRRIRPCLVERQCGGWLALSPPDAILRIGVVGDTEQEAREKFIAALMSWEEILETTAGSSERS